MVILQNGKLEKQAFYYYMGHVSRFIPPGSVRIGATVTGDSILATVARTPSGNIVVVAMNEWDGPSSFTLIDPRHGKVQTSLPPHSIATFVYA